MCCLGVFKRVVPFLLTFAVGLFIASFFVTLMAPNFGGFRRQSRLREFRHVRVENDDLRRENARQQAEIENLKRQLEASRAADIDMFTVPPPPPVPTVRFRR